MPYIKPKGREKFKEVLEQVQTILDKNIISTGDMNYLLTSICHVYLSKRERQRNQVDYTTFNELIGVLECAKLELYRRCVVPYEDKKIKENGDV